MKQDGTFPPRVLLAKIGLDGHDRGVKVLARSFRDAGIDVIYTGLWQTCEATMQAALQEDVDVVGVSLLSAAHMTVMPELVRIRQQLGIEHIPLVLGGIVPESDHAELRQLGIAAVFNPGAAVQTIVEKMFELAGQREPAANDELSDGFRRQDMRCLARLLTSIQRSQDLDGCQAAASSATVIGVTGAPGVGKSSVIGMLSQELLARGKKVAVVAIDPTSPVTGGALLGDRLRMMTGSANESFFIRSLSSGTVQGGLGPHCSDVVDALAAFGFDYVLVETVGAGQADVAISELTDNIVLLLMPETGDAVQFSKAGIMEIASCFVLNKCDLHGADATEAQLRNAINDKRPVYRVSTVRQEGLTAVADWVETLR